MKSVSTFSSIDRHQHRHGHKKKRQVHGDRLKKNEEAYKSHRAYGTLRLKIYQYIDSGTKAKKK